MLVLPPHVVLRHVQQITAGTADSLAASLDEEERVPFDDIMLGGLLGKGRCAALALNPKPHPPKSSENLCPSNGHASAPGAGLLQQPNERCWVHHGVQIIADTTDTDMLPASCSFGNVYFGVWRKSRDCEVDVAVKVSRSLLLLCCMSSVACYLSLANASRAAMVLLGPCQYLSAVSLAFLQPLGDIGSSVFAGGCVACAPQVAAICLQHCAMDQICSRHDSRHVEGQVGI